MRCVSSSSGRLRAVALAAVALAGLVLGAGFAAAGPAPAATSGVALHDGASSPEAAFSRASLRAVARPRGVRVVEGTASDSRAAVDRLERAGYKVDVAVLPSTFFVREHAGHGALPAGFADVTPPGGRALETAPAPEPVSAGASSGAAAGLDPPDPFGGRGDMLPPLSRSGITGPGGVSAAPPMPAGLAYGTRWTDTSELMIGRVAVPLLFPESDGSIDANLYNWTPALRDSILRSATRGLLKWTALAAARGVPLTFLIEVHASLPTGYEPITRTVSQELDWIAQVLKPLAGYGNDAEKEAYDVANAARARLGAHWATLLIAVQNDTDTDGAFPDGLIAHANLGGPWYVVPINNLNTQAPLDFYMEHEMTHMFWALDEFPASNAWWSCTLTTGYFGWPNANSAIPTNGYCGLDARCVMKGVYLDSLCTATEGQIGWADRDLSGVLDLYETRPAVKIESWGDESTTLPSPIRITGRASDVAFPNSNPFLFGAGDSITIATIDSLWYRVDDAGPWVPLPSVDGVMDQGAERFTFVLTLPVGDHVVRFLALNSSGRTGLVPDSVQVKVSSPSGPPAPGDGSPPASVTAAPTPSRGPVRLTLRGPAGAEATAEIFDASGRRVRAWTLRLSSGGLAAWDWNGAGENGQPLGSGVYFLRARWESGTLLRRVVLLR